MACVSFSLFLNITGQGMGTGAEMIKCETAHIKHIKRGLELANNFC